MDGQDEEEPSAPPVGSQMFIDQEFYKLEKFTTKKSRLKQYKTIGTLIEGILNAEHDHTQPWEKAKNMLIKRLKLILEVNATQPIVEFLEDFK